MPARGIPSLGGGTKHDRRLQTPPWFRQVALVLQEAFKSATTDVPSWQLHTWVAPTITVPPPAQSGSLGSTTKLMVPSGCRVPISSQEPFAPSARASGTG